MVPQVWPARTVRQRYRSVTRDLLIPEVVPNRIVGVDRRNREDLGEESRCAAAEVVLVAADRTSCSGHGRRAGIPLEDSPTPTWKPRCHSQAFRQRSSMSRARYCEG